MLSTDYVYHRPEVHVGHQVTGACTLSYHDQYVDIEHRLRGPPLDSQGGGAEVFVAGKLFISTGLGGALKISHFVTCIYGTVLEVNYLFHAESARNYLFQKYFCPPPLGI